MVDKSFNELFAFFVRNSFKYRQSIEKGKGEAKEIRTAEAFEDSPFIEIINFEANIRRLEPSKAIRGLPDLADFIRPCRMVGIRSQETVSEMKHLIRTYLPEKSPISRRSPYRQIDANQKTGV